MESLGVNISHAGTNPATDSDQVKALVVGAGPFGCGKGHEQAKTEGGGPRAASKVTGKSGMSQPAYNNADEIEMEDDVFDRLMEEKEAEVFQRRDSLKRTPPMVRKTVISTRKPVIRGRTGTLGQLGDPTDLFSIADGDKRKRSPEETGRKDKEGLKDLINHMMEGIQELSRTISLTVNTRGDVVACATRLEVMSRRLANGRLDVMMDEMVNQGPLHKTPKVQLVKPSRDMATQTDMEEVRWVKRKPKFLFTTVKEGTPLSLDSDWNLAVIRDKRDPRIDGGIQRLFRNKFAELVEPQGEVAHIKIATWVMGKEEEPPITKMVFRIDEGDPETIERRVGLTLDKLTTMGKSKIAIAWDDQLACKLEDAREGIERAAAKYKATVAIHVKPRRQDKIVTKDRRPETEAIVIKRAEGQTYANTLMSVRKEVLDKGLEESIKAVRETKGGDLVLTIASKSDSKGREDIKKALQNKLGKDKVRAVGSRADGIVHVKDIEAVASAEEVKKAVLVALGYKEDEEDKVKIASLRAGFAGTQNAVLHLAKQDEAKLLQAKKIRIGLPNCRIVEDKKVRTCFKCWMPGHSARACTGPDRSKACRNCGKEGHIRKNCTEDSKCLMCGKSGHPANTTRCPLFKKAIEARAEATPGRKSDSPRKKRKLSGKVETPILPEHKKGEKARTKPQANKEGNKKL